MPTIRDSFNTSQDKTMSNPFAKTRPQHQPYAIYRSGHFIFHVCKTYKKPINEVESSFSRWFVWAASPLTCGGMEAGDTYCADIKRDAKLVAAEPKWLEYYGKGKTVPTPQEYIAQHATVEVN
jgi:hypothetical protein